MNAGLQGRYTAVQYANTRTNNEVGARYSAFHRPDICERGLTLHYIKTGTISKEDGTELRTVNSTHSM
jgi:hypothetical protein